MVQTKALLGLQAVLQLAACQGVTTSPSSLPTSTIPFTSPATLSVSVPSATATCQCSDDGIVDEITSALGNAVDAASNTFQSGFNIFNLPEHINSLQSVFNDLAGIAGNIDCISYDSQAKVFNVLSQVLEIVHELLEGIESFEIVEFISPLVPGLNLINEVISGTVLQLNGGLSRQPCCVLSGAVNGSSKEIDDVNTVIDAINVILPLAKLKHVSGFDFTSSSGQCTASA